MSTELKLPELGENIDDVVVAKVLVAAGDTVGSDQTLIEVEASKAVLEVPSLVAGTIEQLLVSEGDTIKIGQPFAIIAEGADAPIEAVEAADPADEHAAEEEAQKEPTEPEVAPPIPVAPTRPMPPPPIASNTPHVPAAPSVRRFARELGIDVDTVRGTGPAGRVSREDVMAHVADLNANRRAAAGATPAPPLPDFSKWGPIDRQPMSAVRAATARHLAVSWEQIPRVTHFDEADITQLDALRRRYADRAAASGGKLTMAVMVVKIVADALRKFPAFNSSVDMATQEIIFKDYVHVGIAVATQKGLLVPVLRNTDKKNMVQIAGEVSEIAQRCRDGKLGIDEMEGGTFTVTNLGAIGGQHFTPIINHPQVAILGMGRAVERVVINDGITETRTILPLSLSYDHRVIDGADAARFTRWIVECIEEPLVLALEGVS